jgi:hypothetical protein
MRAGVGNNERPAITSLSTFILFWLQPIAGMRVARQSLQVL